MFIDLLSYAWQYMDTVRVEKLKLVLTKVALTLGWAMTVSLPIPKHRR
jgi:hypothetical protein